MAVFSLQIKLFLPLVSLFLLTVVSTHAQNELVANKDAVKLQRIWTQTGETNRADEYGKNVWGGVDFSGDDTADFAIYKGKTSSWLFYEGGNPPAEEPFFIKDSVGSVPPYLRDFLNDGRELCSSVMDMQK